MRLAPLLLYSLAYWPAVPAAQALSLGTPEAKVSGTAPERQYLPASAINAKEVPHIVIEPGAPDDRPLPYYSIAPNTYMFYANIAEVDPYNRGFNGNAGFVVTHEGVVAIDALGTPKLGRRMIATIRSVTDKPIRYLILTHNHPDHSYGAIAFRRLGGVTVIAHQGTLDYLGSTAMESSVAFRRSLISEDMNGFEPVKPDVLVDDEPFSKYSFSLGEHTFDVYNVGKHHSHGDLIIHQVKNDIVWISDLAFNQRVTFMGDGSSKQAIEAQTWLLQRFPNAKLMVPGHGSAQAPPFPMVEQTRVYMQRLRDTMAEAVEEGVDLDEAVNRAEFPEFKDVRLYNENQRKNANFVYREIEQELLFQE
jgi:glyoxylase-like metal-dependent hydrolase (beta-lactamase superfamily II)